MILGRVTGHVVATHKCPDYEGRKVLIVQPVDGRGKASGRSLLAVDAAQAGIGDTVFIIDEGGSARVVLDTPDIKTIRTVIAGIVDEVTQ